MGRATIVRYSEAFKLQVVNELETGVLESVAEARRRYGIPGSETVVKWLKKYGRAVLLLAVHRVAPDMGLRRITN